MYYTIYLFHKVLHSMSHSVVVETGSSRESSLRGLVQHLHNGSGDLRYFGLGASTDSLFGSPA
ncbi:hypothetical protein Hanom_Chr08g00706651 [Helianthus anomalus]